MVEVRYDTDYFRKIKQDFPILERKLNRKEKEVSLIYLDNAATTQKPRQVIDSILEYYTKVNANVHRALHQLGEEATILFEQSRKAVKSFIGAALDREIVFTRGTTESINLVAFTWGRKFLKSGDVILLSEMEHHSNLIPWQMLCREAGCSLRFIPFDKNGDLEWEYIKNSWDQQIKLVALTHMSNVFGTITPVKDICRFAHENGATVLIDGAQGAPHIPVDVQDIGCDFYAFSGHKMCGPTGIGVLYGRSEILESMPPYQGGGDMIRSVWLTKATWNELPYKFEAGTPDICGAIALRSALDYLKNMGMDRIRNYEKELTDYGLHVLSEIDGLTVYGHPRERGGIISFNFMDIHPHDVAQVLDRHGIAVRAGHHCAHPLMRKLEIPATVRASFYFYNNKQEIDALAEGLEKVKEVFYDAI